MKKLIAALALTSAAIAAPAFAAKVGITIRLGDPGFYGQLDIFDGYRPRVIYRDPVVIHRRAGTLAPVYLRVPLQHSRDWRRYCDRYNACYRPVYFVNDDWYREVYIPRYRDRHVHDRRDDRRDWRDDRRDDRRDWGNDRRDDRRDGRREDRRDDRRDDRSDGRGDNRGDGRGDNRGDGRDGRGNHNRGGNRS